MKTDVVYKLYLGAITITSSLGLMALLVYFGASQVAAGFAVLITTTTLLIISVEENILKVLSRIECKVDEITFAIKSIVP